MASVYPSFNPVAHDSMHGCRGSMDWHFPNVGFTSTVEVCKDQGILQSRTQRLPRSNPHYATLQIRSRNNLKAPQTPQTQRNSRYRRRHEFAEFPPGDSAATGNSVTSAGSKHSDRIDGQLPVAQADLFDQSQSRHPVSNNTKRLSIDGISVRYVYRVQLLANFVNLYLSGDDIARYHHNVFAKLPGLDLASSTLQASADAICFVGLGAAYQDERLIAEARLRYGAALSLLAIDVARHRPQKERFRSTITSMMLLRMCGLFDALASSYPPHLQHNKGYHWHLKAVQYYMQESGPEGLLRSDLDWNIFQNVRHYTFYADIMQRSSSMFAQPDWLAITEERARTDPGVALYNLRAQVPGLLTRVERAKLAWSRKPEGSPEMFHDHRVLHQDLHWLRTALASWLSDRGHPFGTERVEPIFVPSIEQDPKAYELDLLKAPFRFTSAEEAGLHTTCWMLCLTIDQAIAGHIMTQSNGALTPIHLAAAHDVVTRDAYVCAISICRSLNWCCSKDVARCPSVGAFLLRFVKRYFEKAGFWREVAWCVGMEQSIKASAEDGSMGAYSQVCRKISQDQSESLFPIILGCKSGDFALQTTY